MSDKPKLTEEQAKEVEKYYLSHPRISVSEALAATGYMDKLETALEGAERSYNAWCESDHRELSSCTYVHDMYTFFDQAIKELKESKK